MVDKYDTTVEDKGLGLWCLTLLSAIFKLYCGGLFIGGRNQNTRSKQPTFHKSMAKCITNYCIEYTSPERDWN